MTVFFLMIALPFDNLDLSYPSLWPSLFHWVWELRVIISVRTPPTYVMSRICTSKCLGGRMLRAAFYMLLFFVETVEGGCF